jgi:hypoxanthine phosphoribosyltransferase
MKASSKNYADQVTCLISRRRIDRKVRELAREVSRDYRGKNPLVLGILKGSFIFMADLVREMDIPVECGFIQASSYGRGIVSSGKVKIAGLEKLSIRSREIILVEDIIDTGLTLKEITRILKGKGAGKIKICALMDKPARRKADIHPDYLGFTVPDHFLVGFGLDWDEKYRELPYVGYIKKQGARSRGQGAKSKGQRA